jgi:DNA-binding response OmpR family regulator
MPSGPLLLYFQPMLQSPLSAKGDETWPAIVESGFHVLRADCPSGLYRLIEQHVVHGKVTVAAVLAGSHDENCVAAAYVRAMHPTLPIVALTDSDSEDTLIELLRCGVDYHCPVVASGRLLAAIVTRLLASAMARRAAAAVAAPLDTAAYWALDEKGWVLCAPQGICVPLTTGERAFMSTLMLAPGLRAAHGQLVAAVASSYCVTSSRHGTLGVLLSRLRRKAAAQGLSLPVKSVHNWGYMFAAAVDPHPVRPEAPSPVQRDSGAVALQR